MKVKPVKTKQDFVRRYQLGEFGNRSPTWEANEWLRIGQVVKSNTLFHLRNKAIGGKTYYNLMPSDLYSSLCAIPENERHNWYVSEMAPTDKTLVQGEVSRTSEGLYFRYTTEKLPMREALEKSQCHAYGIMAKSLLQKYLCPKSYEWLSYLLDTYEDHIVELSAYSVFWGTVPGHNAVFWEVRSY